MTNSIVVSTSSCQRSIVFPPLPHEGPCQHSDLMHIGEVIKRLREEKDWSLNRLATEADVDPGNLSRLENGRAGVRDDSLKRICDALGIKVWELYLAAEEEGDPRKRAMLDLWDKLSPDQRDALFRLLGVQTDQQAK